MVLSLFVREPDDMYLRTAIFSGYTQEDGGYTFRQAK